MHIVGSFGKFKRAMLRKHTRNVLLAARKEDRIGRRLTKLSVLPQHVILLLVEPQKKSPRMRPACLTSVLQPYRAYLKKAADKSFLASVIFCFLRRALIAQAATTFLPFQFLIGDFCEMGFESNRSRLG